MAAMANIVAYDGAATPVSHTFSPCGTEKEKGEVVSRWREQLAGVPLYACPTVTARARKLPNGIWRVSTRVEVPVMESVSGQNAAGYTAAPAVAYVNTAELVGFFSERAAIADHRIVRMLAVNIANNITASVAAATAGMLPDLFDTLVTPT
jgi:hypothetical protein